MANGQLNVRTVKLGDNADTTKNFLITVPAVADGTLEIKRESGTAVATIDAAGKVTFAGQMVATGNVQTWQTVARTINTDYTNNTGQPITLFVRAYSATTSSYFAIFVGGAAAVESVLSTAANLDVTAQCLIPAGTTYKWANIAGSFTANVIRELR